MSKPGVGLTPIAQVWLHEVEKAECVDKYAKRAAYGVAAHADNEGHLDAAPSQIWAERIHQATDRLMSWRTAKSSISRLRRDGYLEAIAYTPRGTEQRLRLPETKSAA